MLFFTDNPWRAQKSSNKTRVQVRGAILPLQVSLSPTMWALKSPRRTRECPGGVLCSTLSKDSNKGGYAEPSGSVPPPEVKGRLFSRSPGWTPTYSDWARGQKASAPLPTDSNCWQVQIDRESNPSKGGWFQNLCRTLRWGRRCLVGTCQPRAPALAPSPS